MIYFNPLQFRKFAILTVKDDNPENKVIMMNFSKHIWAVFLVLFLAICFNYEFPFGGINWKALLLELIPVFIVYFLIFVMEDIYKSKPYIRHYYYLGFRIFSIILIIIGSYRYVTLKELSVFLFGLFLFLMMEIRNCIGR